MLTPAYDVVLARKVRQPRRLQPGWTFPETVECELRVVASERMRHGVLIGVGEQEDA